MTDQTVTQTRLKAPRLARPSVEMGVVLIIMGGEFASVPGSVM